MKAAVIHGYGEAFDTIVYEDVQTPAAGPGELLIKVHASGVNHCDTDLRKGLFGVESPMPHVMGVGRGWRGRRCRRRSDRVQPKATGSRRTSC